MNHHISEQAFEEKFQHMEEDLLRPIRKIGFWGKMWIVFLVLVSLAGVGAYILQEVKSKHETINLNDYTMWGVYISTFVFYVALSLVGALMSAVLKLTNFEWHRPITRIAEIMALAAIMLAGLCIVAAMGRPERLWHLFVYGRIQSPIIWDVIVIMTYTCASFLLLFMPLIPEIALCRDKLRDVPKWQQWLYRVFSFNWKGTHDQWKIVHKSTKTLALLVIPLGVSIHTVTAWLFATTLRAEWDSTNFGPYFVSGAFLLGTAAVICVMFILRKTYGLQKYFTNKHFDRLARALVFFSMVYTYFNINEYLVPSYKMSGLHRHHLLDVFTGHTAVMYWLVVYFGMLIPATLPMHHKMRHPLPISIIAFFVVVAAWFKRYLIVIPGLAHPYMPIQDVPHKWLHYSPSAVELTVIAGSFAAFMLIITLFTRFVPIISIWEVKEGELEHRRALTGEHPKVSILK